MVKHGKQSNDAIIQSALKQIRFDINLSDVSSVDKITLNIRNTLMRDLPPKVRVNPQLQQVKMFISTYNRDLKQKSMMLIRSTLPSIQKHAGS